MDSKEYISNLMKLGITYKKNPPYSIEEAFDCYSWIAFIRNKFTNDFVLPEKELPKFKSLGNKLKRVYSNPQAFDIVMMYLDILQERHVGLMLDNRYMTHCTVITNGISIVDINRNPWKNLIRLYYRSK